MEFVGSCAQTGVIVEELDHEKQVSVRFAGGGGGVAECLYQRDMASFGHIDRCRLPASKMCTELVW